MHSGQCAIAPSSHSLRKLSGPVSRDTARLSRRYPPIARYGIFGVSTWPIGCDTPSPFSECFPLGKHAKWRCDTPPQKGYLSDTCTIPYQNKENSCDTPLRDTISKKYCAIWGGISHWAAKCANAVSLKGVVHLGGGCYSCLLVPIQGRGSGFTLGLGGRVLPCDLRLS